MSAVAQLDAVSKSYPAAGQGATAVPVLQGADLLIGAGEIVVVRGPSGSGKSTLLNLLGALDQPDAGKVVLGGRDLSLASDDELTRFRRDHIGFVFQFFNLIEGLTVLENVRLPLQLRGDSGQAEHARLMGLLGEVGLATRTDALPDQLSGGEQQRVAVVRALVHRPQLILADEPTGNLDEASAADVLDLLCSMVREAGTSLVLVTHSEQAAARGDRVLQVSQGKLLEA